MSNLLGDNWTPAVLVLSYVSKGVTHWLVSTEVFGSIFLVSVNFWNILISGSAMFLAVSFRNFGCISTFLGVLVPFGYRILLFQVFDQFLVEILEYPE